MDNVKMPARQDFTGEFLDNGKYRTPREWERWMTRQDTDHKLACFKMFAWCAYTHKQHPRFPTPFVSLNYGGPV